MTGKLSLYLSYQTKLKKKKSIVGNLLHFYTLIVSNRSSFVYLSSCYTLKQAKQPFLAKVNRCAFCLRNSVAFVINLLTVIMLCLVNNSKFISAVKDSGEI